MCATGETVFNRFLIGYATPVKHKNSSNALSFCYFFFLDRDVSFWQNGIVQPPNAGSASRSKVPRRRFRSAKQNEKVLTGASWCGILCNG